MRFTRKEQLAAIQEEWDRLAAMTDEELDAECAGEGFDPAEILGVATGLLAEARTFADDGGTRLGASANEVSGPKKEQTSGSQSSETKDIETSRGGPLK